MWQQLSEGWEIAIAIFVAIALAWFLMVTLRNK